MSNPKAHDKHCEYNNFKRARYFHGMLLTDRDFREEQIYHNEKRKLLNRMLHGWGVVSGLGISWEQGKNIITIEPGVALDCHGNEIIVCDPYEVDLGSASCLGITPTQKPLTAKDCEELEQATGRNNTFYLGIRYTEVPTDPVPTYMPGGGCEEKVCDYSRTREGFCLEVFSQMPYQPHEGYFDPSLIKRILDNCKGIGEVRDGTTYSVTANTLTLEEDAPNINEYYTNMEIEIEFYTLEQHSVQTRKIIGYNGETKTITVDQSWDPVPDATANVRIDYEITNEECLRGQLQEFKSAFCTVPLTRVECCPDEHYIILGMVEMDPTQWTVQNISLNQPESGRTYVPTVRLGRYLFKSMLNGLDTFFEIERTDGTMEPMPDINLIHTNPVAALCWLGQAFVDQVEINFIEKQAAKRQRLRREVSILGREVKELRNMVEKMTKKTK